MGTKRQDIRTLSKRHPKLETLMYRVDKESLIRQHRLQKKKQSSRNRHGNQGSVSGESE